ncbi:MAG: undecaprenyl-diphosphatase, partial [Frankiales bacterium]|nr:undecaprenyl-diphosphatase [Frankiales bacterium]
ALRAADRRPEDGTLDGRAVLAASLAQVAALAPGVSRSGATLTALRALRVPREQAHRFSLLLSLPVTAGAGVLTLARGGRPGGLAVGAPVAALVGAAAVTAARGHADRLLSGAVAYRLALAATVAVVAARRRSR